MIVKGSGPYWTLTQSGRPTYFVTENPERYRYILSREELWASFTTILVFETLDEAERFITTLNKVDARAYNAALPK